MKTEQLRRLWQLAFGDSEEFIGLFFDTAYAPQRCRYLTVGGQITAALYWLDAQCEGQKFAYIYAVATHPDFRGQGLCRKLMEQTHAQLAVEGYAGALLMPAEAGLRKMYAKMGYQDCTSVSEFSCAAGNPVAVRSVDAEEYARQRRHYLPKGGAVQEGETLRYLAAYAALYAGEDFVLAAAENGSRLFGMELLGNRNAAPGILAALGFEEGTFRVPGEEIPFAMFHPLAENAKAPDYFGLAFD